eukprot:g54033.t1
MGRSRPIINTSTGVVYTTLRAAAKAHSVNFATIYSALNRGHKAADCWWCYVDDDSESARASRADGEAATLRLSFGYSGLSHDSSFSVTSFSVSSSSISSSLHPSRLPGRLQHALSTSMGEITIYDIKNWIMVWFGLWLSWLVRLTQGNEVHIWGLAI